MCPQELRTQVKGPTPALIIAFLNKGGYRIMFLELFSCRPPAKFPYFMQYIICIINLYTAKLFFAKYPDFLLQWYASDMVK